MPRLAVLLACTMMAATLSGASSAQRSSGSITKECEHVSNHVFEVCAAYITLDAHGALQAYYKYAHSQSVLSGLKNIFPKRYKGTAPATIRRWTHVSRWPVGTNDVIGPSIQILNAKSSLACNRAVLVTQESWTVISKTTHLILYRESEQVHTVVLRRVPGEIFVVDGKSLHAWDVYAIYNGRKTLSTC